MLCVVVCCVEDFSDELKFALRENLTRICHGADQASKDRAIYKYPATIRHFWNERYCKKPWETRIGMLGDPTAPERVVLRLFKPPFFPAPDKARVALTAVKSIIQVSGQSNPAHQADMKTLEHLIKSSAITPFPEPLIIVDQGMNRSVISRQGAPEQSAQGAVKHKMIVGWRAPGTLVCGKDICNQILGYVGDVHTSLPSWLPGFIGGVFYRNSFS